MSELNISSFYEGIKSHPADLTSIQILPYFDKLAESLDWENLSKSVMALIQIGVERKAEIKKGIALLCSNGKLHEVVEVCEACFDQNDIDAILDFNSLSFIVNTSIEMKAVVERVFQVFLKFTTNNKTTLLTSSYTLWEKWRDYGINDSQSSLLERLMYNCPIKNSSTISLWKPYIAFAINNRKIKQLVDILFLKLSQENDYEDKGTIYSIFNLIVSDCIQSMFLIKLER